MANFPTHFGTSLVLGASYGTAAHIGYGMPLPSCLLAGGLCTIAGLLPDVDSDNAIIFREVLTFTAAVTPMLMLDHFRSLGWDQESIVVASGLLYVIIRFGLGEIIRRTTVHRGMWHSIPAAAIVTMAIYFLCACPDIKMRLFKASAVTIGFLWHLVLDEIYSIERGALTVRVKKSFGTAFKFFGKDIAGNVMAYGMLLAISSAVVLFPPSSQVAHDHDHGDTNGSSPTPQTQMTPVPGPSGQYVPYRTAPPYSPSGYPQQQPAAAPYSPPSYQPPSQGVAPSNAPPGNGSWHWNR